jgi:hypothetical protein
VDLPKTSITLEDLEHYGRKAQEVLQKQDVSLDDYERLADSMASEGRYFAAAVFYKLAEGLSAGDDELSLSYAHRVIDMMNKVETEQTAP